MEIETKLFLSAVSLLEIVKMPLARARARAHECLPSANQVETRAVCELTQNRSPLCVETHRSVAGPFPLLFRDMSFRDSRHSCIIYRASSRHPLCGTATGLSSLSPSSFRTLSYTGYRLIPHRFRRCLFICRLLQQRVAGVQRLRRLRGCQLYGG